MYRESLKNKLLELLADKACWPESACGLLKVSTDPARSGHSSVSEADVQLLSYLPLGS